MQNTFARESVLKNVLRFSLPYLLSYFLQTLYGMADLLLIGQFDGVAGTTAVSIGSQVMHMVTVMLVGLAMGITVGIGHAVGAGENRRAGSTIGNGAVLFLVLSAALAALLAFLPRIDPHRENYRKFAKGYRVLRLAFALFYLLAACTVPVAALFPQVFRQFPFSRLMLAALGLLFCVLGNFMPKFRHNYFCGIRTPWTLASETCWRRTHRFAGPLWFWGGLALAAGSFFLSGRWLAAATAALGAVLVVPAYLYSYFIYKSSGED